MNESAIINTVTTILETSKENITLEKDIKDLPNWDSIKNLMIFNTIEEESGVNFTDEQLAQVQTLGDIVKILEG